MSLFFHGDAHVSFHFEFHGRIVGLPIEERTVAILLAVEVILEREDVIGGVLVHRRIRIGANNEGCITAISDNDHGNHQHSRVHHASREEVFFLQEKAGQKENQNDADNGTLHEEKCSREGQCEHETDIHAQARFLCIGLHNRPHEGSSQEGEIDVHTRVEVAMERVYKEQLKPTCNRGDARNHAVKNQHEDTARSEESGNGALPAEIVTAEIIHEYDSRNGKQVQEVYANGEAHQIGNENEPTVRTFFVGQFIPFQDSPKHDSRKQRRRRIHLALYCREPERIGEGISQRAHNARTEDGNSLGKRHILAREKLTSQSRNRPKEKQDSEGRSKCRHRVDAHSHVGNILRKKRGKMPH